MKYTSRILACSLSLALCVSSLGPCADATAAKKKKISVKKVTVSAPSCKKLVLAKGKKVKLSTTVTVAPNKKANKKVSYRINGKKIITISGTGVVKGKKAGKTKITVISKKNRKKKATISVVVKKAAVKKISMSSALTLDAGTTSTLTAAVTPKKKASKILAWTSSNPKVAMVANGKVTAVSAGTTTITAKATDGSKKKASCQVTVTGTSAGAAGTQENAKNTITSVEFHSNYIVAVTLKDAQKLSSEPFSVQYKMRANGNYRTAKIHHWTTQDNRNYILHLDGNDYLRKGYYVKVSEASLGEKEAMVGATNPSPIPMYSFSGFVGQDFVNTIYLDEYIDGMLLSVTATNLPAGIKCTSSLDNIKLNGTPTAVCEGHQATITAIDDTGKTITIPVYFYIGDENTLVVGQINTPRVPVNDSFEVSLSTGIEGGHTPDAYCNRDDYTYEILDEPPLGYHTWTTSTQGHLWANFFNTGTYTVQVKITAPNGLSRTIPISFEVCESVTYSGYIRDSKGNPVSDASYATKYLNTDLVEDYEPRDFSGKGSYTEDDGKYSFTVLKGTLLDLTIENYSIGRYTATENQTIDFVLPESYENK
nr:Ig-like domain-containing protein [Eubacterium sp.]